MGGDYGAVAANVVLF